MNPFWRGFFRGVSLPAKLIYRTALWAARADKGAVISAPARGAGYETRCPRCGEVHPPGGVLMIAGDGVSIEDYFHDPDRQHYP